MQWRNELEILSDLRHVRRYLGPIFLNLTFLAAIHHITHLL